MSDFRETTMKRRDFLSLTTLAAGAATLSPLTVGGQVATHAPDEPVWLPLTKDIKTTYIGFGTVTLRTGPQRSILNPKSVELLRYAYDLGIRLFDLADSYDIHNVFAEAMKDKPRDSYTLVTKLALPRVDVPVAERACPEESVKRFLQECKTDYIDVLQLHCITNGHWTQDFAREMDSFAKMKEEGLIRAHGISSHSNAATDVASETEWCEVVTICINTEGQWMDWPGGYQTQPGDPAMVPEVVRAAERSTKKAYDAGKALIAMKVLGHGEGRMANDPELRKKSTKYVMNLKQFHSIIVGFTETEHIDEFVANVADIQSNG